MKESKFQRSVRRHLEQKYSAVCVKYHGGPYSQVGVADLICCLRGRYLAMECKKKSKKPSPSQLIWLKLVQLSGGIAGVVYSLQDVDKLITLSETNPLDKK